MLFRQPPWPPQVVSSTEVTIWNEIEANTDDDILSYTGTESRRLIHVTNLLKKAAERFRQLEHYLNGYRDEAATVYFQRYDDGDDLRRCAFLVEYGRKYQRVFDLLEIADGKLEVALDKALGVITLPRTTEVALDAALKLRRSRMEEAFANLKLYEFPSFVESVNASCSSGI